MSNRRRTNISFASSLSWVGPCASVRWTIETEAVCGRVTNRSKLRRHLSKLRTHFALFAWAHTFHRDDECKRLWATVAAIIWGSSAQPVCNSSRRLLAQIVFIGANLCTTTQRWTRTAQHFWTGCARSPLNSSIISVSKVLHEWQSLTDTLLSICDLVSMMVNIAHTHRKECDTWVERSSTDTGEITPTDCTLSVWPRTACPSCLEKIMFTWTLQQVCVRQVWQRHQDNFERRAETHDPRACGEDAVHATWCSGDAFTCVGSRWRVRKLGPLSQGPLSHRIVSLLCGTLLYRSTPSLRGTLRAFCPDAGRLVGFTLHGVRTFFLSEHVEFGEKGEAQWQQEHKCRLAADHWSYHWIRREEVVPTMFELKPRLA